MSYTTKTPKYQNKFESPTTTTTSSSSTTKTSQLAESIKPNSYLIETNSTNHLIINKKTSLKNLYNKSNQSETKENFKQEMLKKERYPQIQAYENKINEQDEQIRYLQEENRELKSLINYLKQNTECQYCKAKCLNNSSDQSAKLDWFEKLNVNTKLIKHEEEERANLKPRPVNNLNILCECELTEESYELFLDNLLQQLISAIKLNDLLKLETNSTNLNAIKNESISNGNTNKSRSNYTICKSCKKIKLIENKTGYQIESMNSLNNINNITNYTNATSKFESNQALVKFQSMLVKQKEQQLNILNELSKMLNEYKKNELIKEINYNNNNNNNNNAITNNANKSKNSSSFISLTSSSFSRFNFSKVFHSLSSIEIKHFGSIADTTSNSASTSTSSNQALLFSASNINDKSAENTLNLNSSNNNEGLINCMSSLSDSGSLVRSITSNSFEMKPKTSSETTRTQHASKIPKLKKDHVFSYSAQEAINFTNLIRQTKIPIRIVKKKIQQQMQPIQKLNAQVKKSNEISTTSISSRKNVNNAAKFSKKTALNTNSNTSNSATTAKSSKIKFKKIVSKRSVPKKEPPTDTLNTNESNNNSRNLIRSETFDKMNSNCSNESKLAYSLSSSSKTITKHESLALINEKTNTRTTTQINESFTNKKPKRYCFPTHKSLCVYYNDRLNKRHNFKLSDNKNIISYLPIKYLSDTDVSSLADRLSSFDKDLFYNVYHLDTLYSNIDHILFSSYASDTELAYTNCSKSTRSSNSNSNYKLFINDYFNHKYDEDFDDEEEQQEVNEEEEEGEEEKEETKSVLDSSASNPELIVKNDTNSVDLNPVENQTRLVEFSANDFNFDLDNKESIFKHYEMDNSEEDDEDGDVNEYARYDVEDDDEEEVDEDYVDKFNTDDCIDNYYLHDDLLFDDELLKISILNDLSNTLDMKQIKLEMSANYKRNDTYDKKIFLDYVNSPTYSLSSFTSGSNYSLPKSVTDSVSMQSSPIPYQKKCNNSRSKANKAKKSKSLTSQEFDLIERKLAISTPILSESKLIYPLVRKSNSIIPLVRSCYFDNYKEIDKGKNGVLALCSKTFNILPINKNNNNNNKSNDESKLNNFNTDFYKLCSESYLNGSDFNFNSSASILSFNNYNQKKIVNDCCNANMIINNSKSNTSSTNHKSTKHSTDKLIQNSLTFPVKRIQCFNNNE